MTSEEETEALQKALHERLVQTGEWQRLLNELKRALEDCHWEANFRSHAADRARQSQPLKLPDLLAELGPHARETLPAEVRQRIMTRLRNFLDRNLEAA